MQEQISIVLLGLAVQKNQMRLYLPALQLPRGHMTPEEDGHACARRLAEAAFPGQRPYIEQLYTFTGPASGEVRTAEIAYLCILPPQGMPGNASLCALRDGVLTLKTAAGEDIAGQCADAHMIQIALSRVQGKIDYTDIGFYFLADRKAFSLGELQAIYETVLCRGLDASNFRRDLLRRYRDTGRLVQTETAVRRGIGRPASVYALN